jgi:hypothetical protein
MKTSKLHNVLIANGFKHYTYIPRIFNCFYSCANIWENVYYNPTEELVVSFDGSHAKNYVFLTTPDGEYVNVPNNERPNSHNACNAITVEALIKRYETKPNLKKEKSMKNTTNNIKSLNASELLNLIDSAEYLNPENKLIEIRANHKKQRLVLICSTTASQEEQISMKDFKRILQDINDYSIRVKLDDKKLSKDYMFIIQNEKLCVVECKNS